MKPERWQQISHLYDAALALDAGERAAFVREACADDDALRREVESLLAEVSGAAGFMSTPAVGIVGLDSQPTVWPTADWPHRAPNDASCVAPGQRFGPYRIERLLGRGGMGEVYEAEHLEHGRRIALKVLSQRLSGPTDRARFLREGQLAASVSHPHTVYIYGSDVIAGIPAIAMELLPGGTLKDRVDKTGPLTPIDAVDAILQVASGLDAAHRAGVLHRDIKPSNCFVDADGTIKVGDFGLSISTLARDVTQLTATGTVQGTPQFASPEQLRGQPLDVRSDIYAVGATLYYLLTGRPPFDDYDLLVLVSRIATEPPPSPREARPEIPPALAALVLQCLAKDPAHRPASYRVLASALQPFGSMVKMPAPLGIRTAAGVFDSFFSGFVLMIPIVVLLANASSEFGTRPVGSLIAVAYFAITEGVWGASLGKALCGLSVVTESGERPRFVQALVRALFFVLPPWFASDLVLWASGLEYVQRSGTITEVVVQTVVTALFFVPARRANGFAAIHESISHTRTVLKSAVEVRGVVRQVPEPIEVLAGQRSVGPYRLVDTSNSLPNSGAALGYDERLRRLVWLRFPGVGADPVPLERRILGRPARPRWLAGQRASGLAWDAFEQVPGEPFETVVTRAQSWGTVSGWLRDLAEEVQAGLGDGSLPALELDRVWIGSDGRARLLDWPAPNNRGDSESAPLPKPAVDLPQAERFMYRVSVSALNGDMVAHDGGQARMPHVPLPLPAADCLRRLGEQQFTTSEDILTALMSAARGPAAIPRTKRAAHLLLCAIPTIFMLAACVVSISLRLFVRPNQDVARPDLAELSACLNRLAVLDNRGTPSTNPEYLALEVYIAGRHRDLIANPSTWSRSPFAQRPFTSDQRARAERTVAARPNPQEAEVDEAIRHLRPFLESVRSRNGASRYAPTGIVFWRYLWLYAIIGLMVAGTLGLISALAGRGGIVLRLMNIAIVTKRGTVASGKRARLRSALSWLPVLAASAATFAGHSPLMTLSQQGTSRGLAVMFLPPIFFQNEPSILFVRVAIITVAVAVLALGAISAVIRPERGLQDCLAGTWLVPR